MTNQEWFVKAAAISMELDAIGREVKAVAAARDRARRGAFEKEVEGRMEGAREPVRAMHEAVAKSRRS